VTCLLTYGAANIVTEQKGIEVVCPIVPSSSNLVVLWFPG